MKKELPIAVILLAFGTWCCWQLPEGSGDVGASGQAVGASDSQTLPAQVIQTSWQSPQSRVSNSDARSDQAGISDNGKTDEATVGGSGERISSPAKQPSSAQRKEAVTDSEGRLRALAPSAFLRAAKVKNDRQNDRHNDSVAGLVQQITAAPALATHTNIVSELFGVSLVANGKYFQTAGGKKSRMEIQCVSPAAKTVLQMSDGRFVYTLKSDRHQQKLEFIDLYRLDNRRGTASGGLLPTTWVMGGGIGQSLSHYVQSFDFIEVETSSGPPVATAPQGVRVFRGVWKADVLLHLLNSAIAADKRVQSVVWANVPRQLPHGIELTFVSPAGAPAMPQQISYFQFETETEAAVAKEKVRISFMPFQFRDHLPDDLFTLESTDFEVTDMTNVYNARISKLTDGMDKVANQFLPETQGSGRR